MLEFIFLYNIYYDKCEVIYQCKNVTLAEFGLLTFFRFIGVLTFISMLRNIEELCDIYNFSFQSHFQFIVK